MVVASTSLALTWAVSRASSSRRMPMSWASRRASASICPRSWRLASSAVSPAIPSSFRRCSSSAVLSRASLAATARSLGQGALAGLGIRLSPVELVEPSAEMLLLLEDAALDLLDLPLAGAGLLVQLSANLKHQLFGFQLTGADLGLGLPDLGLGLAHRLVDQALGIIEDALGPGLRVTELAGGGKFLSEIADEQGEDSDHWQQPGHSVHPSLHSGLNPGRAVLTGDRAGSAR